MYLRTPGDYDRRTAPCGKAKTTCRGCGATLRVSVETDGHGGLIDVPQECRVCRASRIIVVQRRRRT